MPETPPGGTGGRLSLMSKDPTDKIVALLADASVEKRIAAAIVLGELKAKGPKVLEGLVAMLASEIPALQRPALDALAQIGAGKVLGSVFPLLSSRSDEVKSAAMRVLASLGESVVKDIRARMDGASQEERMALDRVLAELGGKDAFLALLEALTKDDAEAAKRAALQVRHHVKDANARERKSYRVQVERFLKQKDTQASRHAQAAAVKILGYLEDDGAVPTLLAYAKDEARDFLVRHEALIALRFALQKGSGGDDVMDALIDAAGAADRQLARTAMDTLRMLDIPEKHVAKLAKLAAHDDLARAAAVIEKLGQESGPKPMKALVEVITSGGPRSAELAAEALAGNREAVPALAKALVDSSDGHRAGLIAKVLRPLAGEIKPAAKRAITGAAVAKLEQGDPGWEPTLQVARDLDGEAVAEGLRALASKLRKAKKREKEIAVLTLLCKHERASDEDRYRLASAELTQSRRDTSPAARQRDPSLRLLSALLDRGYDVGGALKRDRALDGEELYYVGFHFIEEDHPLGEELLADVVNKGGRSKLAKMAKNKLQLAERQAQRA